MKMYVTTDISDVLHTFKKNIKNNPSMQKKMIRGVLNLGRSDAKKNTYNTVKKKSGDLKNKFYTKLKPDNSGYIVNRASYAGRLEHGGTVVSKKNRYMTFITDDGNWVKVPSFTIKAKLGFIRQMENLYSSDAPLRRMEEILQKELERIYK